MTEWMPVLVAQAWQVTLLIVAVAAINRWAGKSRPHLAHALWLVVLVKCVTPPVWSSPSGLFCWLQPAREAIREPLAVEPPSRSWRDLLAEARELEKVEVVRRDNAWEELGLDAEESLLSIDEFNNPVAEVSSRIIASKVEWPRILLGMWAFASLVVVGVAVVRWLRCWQMLRSAPQRECSELSEQLDLLAKQLKLRRRVRLIVTESRLGPAVIGLFRTTVLLPALIVDRLLANADSSTPRQSVRSASSVFSSHRENTDHTDVTDHSAPMPLVPILAHELLHIRRGDLWVGLLQTLAQAVWWCHPLVWWVNRRTTREAERCCDEEVLAELGCDPAAYARALVDVLELKRELKPVPVFPGVRPVEVTSQRLERIMQLGQGCQRRTPWWCWLLAPLANALDGVIDLDKEPNLGLVYRVRVISGSEDDLRTLAQKFNEKLIAKPGAPVVVEHDELLRLLKEAQTFPRLLLTSHPVATGRGRESVTIADTKTFAVPVESTAADGTTTLLEQSREHGWRLTMQPLSVGIELLRLRVVNELSRLNNDAAVKVRYRTTGEEKLLPGLDVHRINTTVEFKNGQHVVFPITKVPNADSQDVMLVMMQACLAVVEESPQQPEPTPSNVPGSPKRRGIGANSDAGVIGEVVLAKLQLDSLGQLLWQHGSWFVVVRPSPGTKLIGTGESPSQFRSDGQVSVRLSKTAQGFSSKDQILILADEFNLSSNEFGEQIRLAGEVVMDGNGFRSLCKSMALSFQPQQEGLVREPQITAMLRGEVQVRSKTNNGATELKADNMLLYLNGTAMTQLKSDDNGIVAVLRDPPARDEELIRRGQQVLAFTKPDKLVTVHFDNVPLKEAIKQLAQSTGRNIVLEKPGLEDESLTERVPITLALDDVKLSSVLKLMLDPLNLGYRGEESGVIVVTSQQRLKGVPIIATYSVADLSVPIPKRVSVKLAADRSVVGEASKPSEARTQPMQFSFRELGDLIQSTCQPNSWEEVGGAGRLKANDSTLSLVVRQTQDVHDEIRDLLGQLRRLQQTQAALQIETWTVPNDFWDRLRDLDVDLQTYPLPVQKRPADMLGLQATPAGRLLFPQSQPNPPADAPLLQLAVLLRKEAKLLKSVCQTKTGPKVTLFNGQELELIDGLFSPPTRLVLKPVLSGDRQGLRLHAAVLKPDDVKSGAEPDFTKCAVFLAAEHALLLDVFPQEFSVVEEKSTTLSLNGITTKSLGKKNVNAEHRTLLLITGAVLLAEEEESLLGIPK